MLKNEIHLNDIYNYIVLIKIILALMYFNFLYYIYNLNNTVKLLYTVPQLYAYFLDTGEPEVYVSCVGCVSI